MSKILNKIITTAVTAITVNLLPVKNGRRINEINNSVNYIIRSFDSHNTDTYLLAFPLHIKHTYGVRPLPWVLHQNGCPLLLAFVSYPFSFVSCCILTSNLLPFVLRASATTTTLLSSFCSTITSFGTFFISALRLHKIFPFVVRVITV